MELKTVLGVIPSECGTAALGCANESRDLARDFALEFAFALNSKLET